MSTGNETLTYGEIACAAKRASASLFQHPYIGERRVRFDLQGSFSTMQRRKAKTKIELGMKVSVRRSTKNYIGVVTRVEGDYVFVRWTNSGLGETGEYQAHRDDVAPLAGWL